jgi:outer membrane protein OmpA-like peptidoglycan-associated protein
MHTESAGATEAPPIRDRPEPAGFWGKAWPVLVLAFISILLIRACVPSAAPPAPPAFDATAATKSANAGALAALAAVTASTPVEDALKALNLPVVNFATGSAALPQDAEPVLAKAAAVMAMLPATLRLGIDGHTDSTGTAESNLLLSRQRAQAVVDFFVANGVSRERLVPQGHGDARPIATNATEEGRFRNRRIEVRALGQ